MSACKPTRLDPRDQDIAQPYIRKRVTIASSGCWEWNGFKLHAGHGQAKWEGYPHKAHRLSYAAFREEPGDLAVLHKCDNPPCCNPDHLFLGTKGDNNRDAAAKGRYANRKRPPRINGVALSRLQYQQLICLHTFGVGPRAIGKRLGLHESHVSKILRRKDHKAHALYGDTLPRDVDFEALAEAA